MKTILIIGGGITGLSAMHKLQKWKKQYKSDVRLILTEASDKLGGKIRTLHDSGFIMEEGADSIVNRKASSMSFVNELGLEGDIVYNDTGRSFLYTDEELKPIPADSIFGIPTSIKSLANTDLVSAEGKVEALKDFYTVNKSFTENDSIGEFLEYYFGKELVDKQIAPVLSGVYSGHLHDLTISSTLPYVLEYKEQYGSIIKGFEANKEKFQSGGERKFLSFKNGLSTLVNAYEQAFENVDIRKNWEANRIEKLDKHYQVFFNNGDAVEADYVLLCIPDKVAARLLQDSKLNENFSQFKNGSMISIYVGFDLPDEKLPLSGTGFIKANGDKILCNACTWTSRKWKHTSESGNLLVRLFYKSSLASFSKLNGMSEPELLQVALNDIRNSIGIKGEPVTSVVTKWTDSMPNYVMTHSQTVKALEEEMADSYPGILLAGCSYYGVGIPDCIENGETKAIELISLI